MESQETIKKGETIYLIKKNYTLSYWKDGGKEKKRKSV